MRTLRDLFATLPLPPATPGAVPPPPGRGSGYAMPSAHLLGGDLPQGHLHVWSGPPGGGKTAFLLGLLLDGVRRGRGTCLATYDLPETAIALRVLSMESGVPLADLDASSVQGGALDAAATKAVSTARARLEALPLFVLESRGLSVESLADRCVRWTRRIDVLGVDFAEAVVRPDGVPLPTTFRALSDLAHQRWMAVVAISRTSPVEWATPERAAPADRVGRIDNATDTTAAQASIVANRHGPTHSCRIRLDSPRGRWVAADANP